MTRPQYDRPDQRESQGGEPGTYEAAFASLGRALDARDWAAADRACERLRRDHGVSLCFLREIAPGRKGANR